MFDQLIQEVSGRFGLDTRQTRQLLGSAVALVFDDTRGGFAGFTERLHGLGLGEALQSWRAPGPSEPDPVRPGQVEALFGMPVLGALSRRLGLSPAVAAAALGTLLPGVVRQLGGQTSLAPLPAPVAGWVAQGRDLLAEAAPGLTPTRRRSGLGGLLRAVLWLAALAIAVLLLLRACQPTPADPAPAPEPRAEAAAALQAPRAEPRIDLQTQGGQVSVAGRLVNAQEKHRLLEALGDTFGAARVKEQIQLDATVAPATWMDRLVQLLPHLKAGDVKLGLEGDSLRLDSSALPEAGRFDLSQQVSQAFPDFRSEGLWDRAMAALSALKPGFGADDLVLALNQSSLRFASGSAELTRDNAEVLARSAAALRAAPAGTRVEVGGHSDDSGDPATNMALSQARAESVVAALLADGVPPDRLQAKGYGAAQPVADNGTEEGRARNRRMTFTVLK